MKYSFNDIILKKFIYSNVITVIIAVMFFSVNILAYTDNQIIPWDGNASITHNYGYHADIITVSDMPLSFNTVSTSINGNLVNQMKVTVGFNGVGANTSGKVIVTLRDKNGAMILRKESKQFYCTSDIYGIHDTETLIFDLTNSIKATYAVNGCYFECSGSGVWNFTGDGTPFVSLFANPPVIASCVKSPTISSTNLMQENVRLH